MTQTFAFPALTEEQRIIFAANYRNVEKDEVVGVLLAVFLGGFGAHHFYLNRPGTGVLYLLFSWTGVTYLIGWVEAFFMPGRVRRFNAEQAMYLASSIAAHTPATPVVCRSCGATTSSAARFCARCGNAIG